MSGPEAWRNKVDRSGPAGQSRDAGGRAGSLWRLFAGAWNPCRRDQAAVARAGFSCFAPSSRATMAFVAEWTRTPFNQSGKSGQI